MELVCWRWHLGIISTSGKKSCIPWNEGGLWGNVCWIHTMWFIKAFSSQSLFQDWLADGIADLRPHPVTSLLDCTGLVWFLPRTSRQWLHLPTCRAGLLPHAKGENRGWHYLSDRSLEPGTTPTSVLHFRLIIHFGHWNGVTADKELYWTIAKSRITSLVLETRSNG